MTQAALRQWFYAQLSGVYAQGELQTMYHWCTSEIHGWSRAEVYSKSDEELEETDLNRWKLVTNRLTNSEPIQYIFEKAPFFDFELFVDENVLIPRPETEELVQLLLDENLEKDTQVLDIGTGSGCIALAIKNERSHWRVSGCDISEGALSIARKNSALLELDVNFFHADASQMETLSDVDLIISNPPYIPIDSKESLETNVLDHEPHLALFSPESDPFYFFRAITQLAEASKVKKVYFETHATEMDTMIVVLKSIWSGTIRTAKDLGGKERFVILEK
ncbi:peptide chain release factor N(5)-glutamine methyltransferase [bacterium]|nr:peptide chain release factor N(5)-glutamine methyltransferase [bacterium]MDC1221976.1 peptide chain release factor N(5)-glutamine methyltransferase [Salibacteraceae bacterium]